MRPRSRQSFARAIFLVLAAASLITLGPGPALLAGIALALTAGNPYLARSRALTPGLLQLAVVGLGAAMDLRAVASAGREGALSTAVSISLTLGAGLLLGKLLGAAPRTSLLVSVGTAICGGSAIAAVAPVLRARPEETAAALGVVFLLNAAALAIFPALGAALHLAPEAYGQLCALAIHDTSSVVGAAAAGGPAALAVGATVKLTRALWIIPVTFALGRLAPSREGGLRRTARPWFILAFLVAAALGTLVPGLAPAGQLAGQAARHLMSLTLFLTGASLTRDALRAVGLRPLAQGLLLWALVILGASTAAAAGLLTAHG
jgi:uncharacterized integral membrane protein (TIGR00698 family)